MIELDMTLLALLSGTIIPLATGVLTKLAAPKWLKALCSATLAGVTAVVALLTGYAGVGTVKEAVYVGLTAFVAHAGSYYGFMKPTGISGGVQESTKHLGIG